MNCDECKQNPATVHLTEMYNGQKNEKHLCQACAAQKGLLMFDPGQLNIPSLLGGFLGGHNGLPGYAALPGVSCPACGMSFTDIRQTGKLGCPDCYQAFEKEMEAALKRIHGNSRHTGKIPLRSGEKARLKKQVWDLKAQLQNLIMEEDYEKAAEIRDAMKDLEKRLD